MAAIEDDGGKRNTKKKTREKIFYPFFPTSEKSNL